jgi:hypothetical protein
MRAFVYMRVRMYAFLHLFVCLYSVYVLMQRRLCSRCAATQRRHCK